jgi:hypothetical protein
MTIFFIITLLFVVVFLALFVMGITRHVVIYGTKRHMATLLIVALVIVIILEGWIKND